MRFLGCILAFVSLLPAAVILDRIAVIAGTHAIKTSDIDRDIRLTQFINREPLHVNAATKHEAAERLITQDIIRQEIITGGYRRPPEEEAIALEAQLRRDRFENSDQRFRAALHPYGLTEPELRERLLWQLTVLQFIDQRFRAGVVVTDEEAPTPKLRAAIEAERINKNFNDWLDQARQNYRVEYKQEAFE
jgi:peptidyl-prolyl cis-trans isomerase SurA